MNRRELLTGAALIGGVAQANAFGLGRMGSGLGRGGDIASQLSLGPYTSNVKLSNTNNFRTVYRA